MYRKNSIWLTSERHRRSRELSESFGAELYELLESDNQIQNRLLRYLFISFKTFVILFLTRPKLVFVQNPSVFLAALVCFLSNILGFKVIVDRHSNFKLSYSGRKELKWFLFRFLSNYTLKKANITIVTNFFLAKVVKKIGGTPFVLEDKLPDIRGANWIKLEGRYSIVVITTFSNDEPIEALISAALRLPDDCIVFFTGRAEKYIPAERKKLLGKKNIRFTGFLPDRIYQSYIKSADLVIVLTTQEHLLNCGAYEAVALEKPLIISNTETLKNYFREGVIYTDPDSESILNTIVYGISNKEQLGEKVAKIKTELSREWQRKAQSLIESINSLSTQ